MTRLFTCLVLLAALAAGAQINPKTQIRWPANCNAPGVAYNFNLNTCIPAAGAPGGANGEVQINNAGSFGSIPGLVYSNSGAPFLNGRPGGLNLAVTFLAADNVGSGFNGSYLMTLPYNAASGGLGGNAMACLQSDGLAHPCSTASNYWTGLAWSVTTDPVNGPVASVAIMGASKCQFDNTPVPGHFVVLSTSTAGLCHDSGTAMPASGTLVGQVVGANVGGVAPVYLMHGAGAGAAVTSTQAK